MEPYHHIVSSEPVGLYEVRKILQPGATISLSGETLENIRKCHQYLQQKISEPNSLYYGINTGFGALYHKTIDKENLSLLQEKLIVSHACGMGNEVPAEIVKLMLFLKIQSLSYGYSGVHENTVLLLTEFFNRGIWPVIYEQGSLGASGDLAPLAHLSLPLLGKGEVYYKGRKTAAAKALQEEQLSPLTLGPKEGLALLNGTQFMSAYGSYILHEFQELLNWADLIAALSLDAFDGRKEPFYHRLHELRGHQGQIDTADNMLNILSGSEMLERPKQHVQDPYSFRCIPQVHGASRDAYWHALSVFSSEINAVTDNPNIFPDEDLIISGGNFHGQPLAIYLDFLCIAMAETGSISERRTYKLISGQRELPAFLVASPGLDSGLMIAQYTAASIVSQNKQLCTPASIDTIDSSNGQEDHVSMGANAATKAFRVLENTRKILAIELLTAAQAMDFRRPYKTSPLLEKLVKSYRETIPFIETDNHILHELMQASVEFIRQHSTTEFWPENEA